MRLIHTAGFTDAERESYRELVLTNVIQAMRLVLENMENLGLQLQDPALETYIPLLMDLPNVQEYEPFPDHYLAPLKSFWQDNGVQQCYQRGNEFALHDNMSYFYSDIDRLWQKSYMPSDQDILRCRAKTTGIVETTFLLGALTYKMFDVGGQRSERKKWIHCFDNVTAVLFVVAISGYDQCLIEDKDSNQMHEAFMIFDSVCNSQYFVNTAMILFLNKIDIFKDKLVTSDLSRWFPDYNGPPNDYKESCDFFRRRFTKLNRTPSKEVYTHFTNATDTSLLKVIMASVTDIILTGNLRDLVL